MFNSHPSTFSLHPAQDLDHGIKNKVIHVKASVDVIIFMGCILCFDLHLSSSLCMLPDAQTINLEGQGISE